MDISADDTPSARDQTQREVGRREISAGDIETKTLQKVKRNNERKQEDILPSRSMKLNKDILSSIRREQRPSQGKIEICGPKRKRRET